jgi:hypothetical protein
MNDAIKKWEAIESRIDGTAKLLEDDLKDMGLPDRIAHGIAMDCADAAYDVADGKVITDAGLDVTETMHKYKTVEIDDNTDQLVGNVPWDDDADYDTRYIGDPDLKDVAWNDEASYAVDPSTEDDSENSDEDDEDDGLEDIGLNESALEAIIGPTNTELDEIEEEMQAEARKHVDVVDVEYEEIIIPDNDNEETALQGVA